MDNTQKDGSQTPQGIGDTQATEPDADDHKVLGTGDRIAALGTGDRGPLGGTGDR